MLYRDYWLLWKVIMPAEVGEKAPDFTLPSDSWDEKVSLEDVTEDGPVVLFFYPGDWSSVCTDQMGQVQAEIERFQEKGASVLAISADTPWSHRAWAEERASGFRCFRISKGMRWTVMASGTRTAFRSGRTSSSIETV